MTKEVLDKALDVIIEALDKSDIDIMDNVELMLNIRTLLEHYDRDIEVLRKGR